MNEIKLETPIEVVTVQAVEEKKESTGSFFPGRVNFDMTERGAQMEVKFSNQAIPPRLLTLWQLDEFDNIPEFKALQDVINKRAEEILKKG